MFTNKNSQRRSRPGFGARTLLALLVAGAVQPIFAEKTNELTFKSPEQAVEALFTAVKTDDQATILRLIGPLASSGQEIEDKADREVFVRKYLEMHRLVKEPDGTTVLYIGAENWPFPVPLVSKNGTWRFDVDAGKQEAIFRRIGENETTAIETCRAIGRAIGHNDSNADDNAVDAYAQKVVTAPNATAEPFHGYYFQLLRTPNGVAVVAYPSEYGSTGVMTFALTADGPVLEKDLGPNTATVAKSIKAWTRKAHWQVVQE
jgi:hypothetical protein